MKNNHCSGCKKQLQNGDKVTVVIPNVDVTGRFRKGTDTLHLKLSSDGLESRATLLFCTTCLDITKHINLEDA